MFLHNSIILNFQISVKGHFVYEIIKELISKGESTTQGLLIGSGVVVGVGVLSSSNCVTEGTGRDG